MALSRPTRGRSREEEFVLVLTRYQTLLMEKKAQLHALQIRKSSLKKQRLAAERRCRVLAAVALQLCARETRVWMLPRPPSWYDTTVPTLSDADFKANFRVTRQTFAYIVSSCSSLVRQDTNMRRCIPLHKRVALSLYRLASSAEERTVAHLFSVSRSSVNNIYREFCDILVDVLEPQIVCVPSLNDVQDHVRQFEASTGFPQGFGALDGCHVKVSPPKENAQDYYNYKGWYSVILLALVDHNYKFMFINVGSPGRNHDSAVYKSSVLARAVNTQLFSEPAKQIEGEQVGAIILCDQAFPLTSHLMKPYPNRSTSEETVRHFNYTLSKARRVVENAFGRLKARFRVLKSLECEISNANRIIRACCVLHNICEHMRDHCDKHWCDEAAASELPQPVRISSETTSSGERVRNALAKHIFASRM